MKILQVKISKTTGYKYLEAEKVKEAIEEIQKRIEKINTLQLQPNQSHQTIMIPTQLAEKIVRIAKYMRTTPDQWIIDRLKGQVSRFHYKKLS